MRFKKFLTEAAFSNNNLNKVVRNLRKIFEKKLGKLYRYGGKDGFIELKSKDGKKYIGVLFIESNKAAFQLNFKRTSSKVVIDTISVWKKYIFNAKKGQAKPDFTIDVTGMNIVQFVQLFDKIADHIRHPMQGKFEVGEWNENIKEPEKYDLLAEAKRVPLEVFRQAAITSLGKDRGLTRAEIKMVAQGNDYNQPNLTKLQKPQRGLFDLYWDDEKTAKDKDKKHKVYISIRNGDTNKFEFPQLEKAAALIKAAADKVSKVEKPSKEEIRDPNRLFGRLAKLVKFVACKDGKSLFIFGGGGTGKSFTVKEVITKDCGLRKNKDWVLVKGKVTPSELYKTLYMHREKGKLIVFDDADSAFEGNDAANILKAALDSYDERIISWVSPRTLNVSIMSPEERAEYEDKVDTALREDPENTKIKFPSEFEYEGKIIFISNLNKDKVDQAVLSRSYKIDMTLTQEEMFLRMEGIIDKLGGSDISTEEKLEIIKKLKNKTASGELNSYVNMRTFVAALGLYKSGFDDWDDLIQYT